jgi:Multiple antibiotic transporter
MLLNLFKANFIIINHMGILETSIQLFFLLNPLASLPLLFLALKKGLNVRSIALRAVIIAFSIALTFIFIGRFLFEIFGITLDSFKAAGGIIIILLGIEMVLYREKKNEDISSARALVSILATPMLTGPATLSFLTIKSFELGLINVLISLLLAFIGVSIVFLIFVLILSKIKMEYIEFISKLFGLFITAFGIEMLFAGVKKLIF